MQGDAAKFTKAMIQAGVEAFCRFYPDSADGGEYDSKMVSAVLNAAYNRGKLIPQPCKCGATKVEMHHPDYSKPLLVEWLCRPCHLDHHKLAQVSLFRSLRENEL